jgi:hypothetical protein
VTRLYFMRLRRLTRVAVVQGRVTSELERARGEHVPTFTHFLDLPLLLVIISLGAIRPDDWGLFAVGIALALIVAAVLFGRLAETSTASAPTSHAIRVSEYYRPKRYGLLARCASNLVTTVRSNAKRFARIEPSTLYYSY